MKRPHTARPYHHQQGGFTLIELLITISIIVLVTGVTLSRYASFDNTVLLQSQAYEIAFDIRQAQQAGISVRAVGGGSRSPFGLHFDTEQPHEYIFFEDNETAGISGAYDTNDTTLNRFEIDNRFEIREVRSAGTEVTKASVTFQRPNFDARVVPGGGNLEIDIGPINGGPSRTIEVSPAGQITVQ